MGSAQERRAPRSDPEDGCEGERTTRMQTRRAVHRGGGRHGSVGHARFHERQRCGCERGPDGISTRGAGQNCRAATCVIVIAGVRGAPRDGVAGTTRVVAGDGRRGWHFAVHFADDAHRGRGGDHESEHEGEGPKPHDFTSIHTVRRFAPTRPPSADSCRTRLRAQLRVDVEQMRYPAR
jgi:hypothetical protein